MKKMSQWIVAGVLCAGAGMAAAQALPEPANVLQLSSSGTVEATQDLLVMTLAATREGSDASAVQSQLQQVLDAALAVARRQAQPGQLDVRTGTFGIYPRNNRDGKITGWQGRAELVLQGRDFDRITRTAAQVDGMQVAQTGFALSREARAKVEGQAQAEAIQSFQAKARAMAQAFGFERFTLREVNVNSNDSGFSPRVAMMSKAGMAAEAAPIPVEAGKTQVVVNVSGSVQMLK
ncbi:SIMPL domain-containing protein [Comamonas endophytica]|uniref:SIMPL domain-containing protein n=1 Tax=Comamonas endophytica TaxID=2949090 RepID=A0ABY6GAA7_9BURK|nr:MULTISPECIES: SIMPL domain-containing protein [unclassified Acidovorax]MCD2514004.1 SIMPL domain-containing protein [Acidovorax sp. D4N7]UYG52006.1 SIMPL domain-containing protein [Acidovorax sp. 5MLIR]